MTREHLVAAIVAWDLVVVAYFVAINTIYLVFCVVAFVQLRDHRRRWTPRRLDAVLRSPATPGISLVAPAYNEEASIRESVRSLLLLHYPQFEVIVVNDGSKDRTLEAMVAEFALVRAPSVTRSPWPRSRSTGCTARPGTQTSP
jgi:cellulose synthase/poly-beta-1,6-N-acetylglucosamine synthase-like glycosyltransferase